MGLYSFIVKYRHIKFLNFEIDGERVSLFKIIIYSIATFGLYYVYFQYLIIRDVKKENIFVVDDKFMDIFVSLLTLGFLWPITDMYIQNLINNSSS